ncbi:hypothetical protein JVU11DRAFT_9195 [Chiua virens]|nr:hypothetical protein JVU11DRAFT_9195 [Chiua virens]
MVLRSSHPDSDFKLQSFFHGELYTSDIEAAIARTATRRKRNQLRATAERQQLLDILIAWREQTHDEDPYQGVWPITRLIHDDGLELLSKTPATGITSLSDLVALEESEEWGSEYGTQIFTIIKQFDQQCEVKAKTNSQSRNPMAHELQREPKLAQR